MKNKTNKKRGGGRERAFDAQKRSGAGKVGKGKNGFKKSENTRKLGTLTGKIDGTSRGFAFLVLESGDLYIPREKLNGARHGDTVSAIKKGDKAEVLSILSRGFSNIVGTYYESGGYGYVLPDNRRFKDILIKKVGGNSKIAGEIDEYLYGNTNNYAEGFSQESIAKTPRKRGKKEAEKPKKSQESSDEFEKSKRQPLNGDKVVAVFREDGKGTIIEVLGRADDEKVQLKAIMRTYGFADKFSRAVLKNAGEVCHILPSDYEGREDFRGDTVFTIDGEDSRDFDDAVSIKKTAKGYVLSVHIADVAHYVTHSSPLDNEAFNRGTSVYFPFGVVPMLPPALSDDICSLKQGEDRLTLSVIMHIDKDGNVYKHRVVEGVICSAARLTYPLAAAIIDDKLKDYLESKGLDDAEYENKLKLYKSLALPLKNMYELCKILLEARRKRGAIEFEPGEAQITMDGVNVVDVKRAETLISHRLIEEFMVLTNRMVARQFYDLSAPFVYRVHAAPPPEKLERLHEFLQKMGLALPGVNASSAAKSKRNDNSQKKDSSKKDNEDYSPAPADFAALLESTPDDLKQVVSTVMLRAMSKAEYLADCKGHYGLSLDYYCHFTSPIRRYPDLVIHRIIKAWIKGEGLKKFGDFVRVAAHQSSVKERSAEEAERDINDLLIAKFMSDFVGETFDGTISGVSEWGLFVRLNNTAEGLVRTASISGLYRQEGYGIAAIDDKYYKLGQRVRVSVLAVSGGKIEFSLED